MAGLASDARMLLSQAIPLVCEHRDFWARNILMDGATVRVVDWDRAQFDSLPLCDLYDLVHTLTFWAIGTQGQEVRQDEMLRAAYSPGGILSEVVGRCIRSYCARLRIPAEWGRVMLPVFLIRQALMHAEHWHSDLAFPMLQTALRVLESPQDFHIAFGLE